MAIEIKKVQPSTGNVATTAPRSNWNMEIRFGAPRISIQQRITFTERLVLLLETGVSLLEALKALQHQPESPLLASIITSIADAISEGKSFSHALGRHPEMFSSTYVSLVGAAEEGGFLPQVLAQLYRMDEKNSQMSSNIKAALSYPIFLIVFSVVVVAFVLVFIFPKFEALFASIHDQLPMSTLFLMALSDLLRHHWIELGAGLGAVAWLGLRWLKSARGKHAIDRAKLRLPVIRDIYTQVYLSQTLSVLGLSLTSGVPITVALKASQGVVRNILFSGFLDALKQHVNEGRGIAIGFSNSAFVPPLVQQMVTTGEQTGNLGLVMTRVAEFYERELAKRITVLSKAIEPIMLIVMGVVVGLIVVSLILPIFKLSRAVQ
jgi:type II secretory pathway component PulF